jgi:hypothetical protein
VVCGRQPGALAAGGNPNKPSVTIAGPFSVLASPACRCSPRRQAGEASTEHGTAMITLTVTQSLALAWTEHAHFAESRAVAVTTGRLQWPQGPRRLPRRTVAWAHKKFWPLLGLPGDFLGSFFRV